MVSDRKPHRNDQIARAGGEDTIKTFCRLCIECFRTSQSNLHMYRKLKLALIIWALLCIPSICGMRLLWTGALYEWASTGDPVIHTIHRCFVKDGRYILDYDCGMGSRERRWATLRMPIPASAPQYDIHRSPISDNDLVGAMPIPVINLRDHLAVDSTDSFSGDAVREFVRSRSSDGRKEIYFHRHVSPIRGTTDFFEATQIYLPVKNPTYHTIELFGNHPKDYYIAPERMPMMVAAWPVAVLGDIFTAPLILVLPRW